MKKSIKSLLVIFWIVSATVSIYGQSNIRTKHFNIENGVALQGYDPVTYFTKNQAVKGEIQFAVNADGVTYYCSSLANKNLLVADYKKYEPQYGGWCAFAMGDYNQKVAIDPKTFKIKDGKLYIFYHNWAVNTLPKWNSGEATLKPNADKNWITVFK